MWRRLLPQRPAERIPDQVRRAVLLLAASVAVVLLTSGVGLAKPASSGPAVVDHWGSYGREDGQFRQPSGVASDASGNIYVADRNNQRIQKFDIHGELITKWGSFGEEDGDFLYPIEVAADAWGNVYVVDQKSPRVQKFDSEGNFVTKWGATVAKAASSAVPTVRPSAPLGTSL